MRGNSGVMSKQIGEELIERGLLSQSQLVHALRLQLIFGGHLGTCLVELGYVDEAALAGTLSDVLGMKCARAEWLQEIPREVLKLIPREEVRRRRAVPFGLRRNALHVAVTKPKMVGGLSVDTGFKIVPFLAPEIYILRAMEQYYGIPRRQRYLEVGYSSLTAQGAKSAQAAFAPSAAASPVRPALETDASQDREHSRKLAEVKDHGELGEVLLDFMSERMNRCILFEVERDRVGVANWRGMKFPKEKLENLAIPLEPDSVLALARDETCYHGELPQKIDYRKFYDQLGIDIPREVLVLPIYGERQLEAVLYGDGGQAGKVDGPTDTYRTLLDEACLALKMLSLRQQLCPA